MKKNYRTWLAYAIVIGGAAFLIKKSIGMPTPPPSPPEPAPEPA